MSNILDRRTIRSDERVHGSPLQDEDAVAEVQYARIAFCLVVSQSAGAFRACKGPVNRGAKTGCMT